MKEVAPSHGDYPELEQNATLIASLVCQHRAQLQRRTGLLPEHPERRGELHQLADPQRQGPRPDLRQLDLRQRCPGGL